MSKSERATRALPENPSLENLKKQARSLIKAVRAGEASASERVRAFHPRPGLSGNQLDLKWFSLVQAQLVIAREYGFPSWPKLAAHVSELRETKPLLDRTALLVDRLYERLLRAGRGDGWISKPELMRLRSAQNLSRMIELASRLCDSETQAALSAIREPDAAVKRLCDFLDARLKSERWEVVGEEPSSAGAVVASDGAACLVVLDAPSHPHFVGRRYLLTEPVTRLGRGTPSQILLQSDSISRVHARIEREGSNFVLHDEQSTNGTFLHGRPEPVRRHVLADGEEVVVGDAILGFLSGGDLEAKYRSAIEHSSKVDPLTRVLLRNAVQFELERLVLLARGSDRPLSVLAIEVDQVRGLRERGTQISGNQALLATVALIRGKLPDGAVIGRLEEDRLVTVLPGSDLQRAIEWGESLRTAVASDAFDIEGDLLRLSVSIGAATLYRTTGAEELLGDATAALARYRTAS